MSGMLQVMEYDRLNLPRYGRIIIKDKTSEKTVTIFECFPVIMAWSPYFLG